MSIFDEERQKMGLPPVGGSSSSPQQSIFAAERARINNGDVLSTQSFSKEDLGLVSDLPVASPDYAADSKQYYDAMKSSYQNNPSAFTPPQPERNWLLRAADYVASNPISTALAEYTVPDQPYLDEPGTNVRQDFLQKSGQAPATGISKFIGQAAAPFFVPGAQLGTGTALSGAAEGALTRFAPKLGGIGQAAAREGLAGGAIGFGSEYAQGSGDLGQAAITGAFGGALGAAGGAAFAGIGKGLERLRSPRTEPAPADTLALPLGRIDRAQARGVLAPNEEPIANPYTFSLPEGTAGTQRALSNVTDAHGEIAAVNDQIRGLESQYTKAVNDQYSLLKSQRDSEGTYAPGGLTFDGNGEVTGKFGTTSLKPRWYQDFRAEHGRKPTNKELYELAKRQVDEGYQDDTGFIPSWKQENAFDDSVASLSQVRDQLRQGVKEQGLGLTDAPLKSSKLSFDPKNKIANTQPIKPNEGELLKGGLNPISSRLGDAFDPQSSGFAALGKDKFQKTRTPDKPESVKDVIDIGGRQRDVDKGSWFERFYSSVVDEQAPLKRGVKSITNEKLSADQDPTKIAWLSRGWKGKADAKLEYGFFDNAGKRVAGGLKQALDPIRKRLNDWREYAVALRSKEYKAAGLESGVPDDVADEAIARYGNDKTIQKADEDIKRFIYNSKKSTLVDSGIWSQSKLDDYKDTQPNYIPMFRTQEKGIRTKPQAISGKGFANVKDPTKQRVGSKKPIVDPVESIIKQQYKEQALADRNNVMRSLVELAEKNPDNPIMRRVQNSKAVDEIQKSLDEFILNPTDDVEAQLRNTLDLLKPQTVNGIKNVVTVMRNGKAEQWEVLDAPIAKVLAGLGGEASNPFINAIGTATGILKAGLVLAPDFVAKNLIRDQLSAFLNSKYGFIPIWDTISGLWSAGKKDDAFYRWMANGGANGAWVSLERDYLQGQINELTRTNIKKLGNPIEVMRKLSEWSEQGTRLGEFKRALKKGASEKEAALASRDVTLDFSRSGSNTKSANKAIAFFNVAIQSIDKLARQFDPRNPKVAAKTAVKAIASITIPSMVLYMYNKDNPKYQELPQWDKDANWHFFLGGEVVRIPKPFEMGMTFGTFFERLMRGYQESDPQAFEEFGKRLLDGFTPSIIPTLLTPWIEAYANKDFFTDAPIVPKREEGRKKEDRYGPYTSEIAKAAGRATEQSPRIIDNYITGYTGTLGRYGLQAADKAYTSLNGIKTPPKPDGGLAGLPVLRSFISKGLEGSSKSVDDFYKERQKLQEEQTSAKFNKLDNTNARKLKQYDKIAERIGDENTKIRAVLDDMNKTPEQKREELKGLNLSIINLARSAKGLQPIKGD